MRDVLLTVLCLCVCLVVYLNSIYKQSEREKQRERKEERRREKTTEKITQCKRLFAFQEVRLKSMSTMKAECELPPCCADTAPLRSQGHSPGGAYQLPGESDAGCCYSLSGTCCMCVRKPALIDKWSRSIFPLVFLAFNLLYWFLYLHISENKDTKDFVWL